MAGNQVDPPSTETSTPPTTPPPASAAVPLIVVGLPAGTFDPLVGEEIVELGSGCIGRSGGGDQTRLQSGGLNAHVRKQIDGRLLHPHVCSGAAAVVIAVETPRTTEQCRPRTPGRRYCAGKRETMRRGARPIVRPIVQQELDAIDSMVDGQTDQASGPEAVIKVFVPLVAQRATGQVWPSAPGARFAMLVLRQKRILPSASAPLMAVVRRRLP